MKYAGHEEEFLGWLTGTLWLMTFDRPFVKIVVAHAAAATTTSTTAAAAAHSDSKSDGIRNM